MAGVGVQPVVVVESADGADASLGAKADSAATTDTGTFSLIALVKRLLSRLTSGDFAIKIFPTSTAPTNGSGSITTGGTAQNALSANSGRKYLFIQNVSTGDLWFSSIATAVQDQPSIRLRPGDSYENPPHFCPTGAISVIGATTGQKFTAREA